jgi:tetratricopeptide (TPR) repeat protein
MLCQENTGCSQNYATNVSSPHKVKANKEAVENFNRASIFESVANEDPAVSGEETMLANLLYEKAQAQEKLNDWAGALETYQKMLRYQGMFAAVNLSDTNVQLNRLSYMQYIAQTHVKLAQQNKNNVEQHWREARSLYQQILDELSSLQKVL